MIYHPHDITVHNVLKMSKKNYKYANLQIYLLYVHIMEFIIDIARENHTALSMIFAYHLKLNFSKKKQVNEILQKELKTYRIYVIFTLRP